MIFIDVGAYSINLDHVTKIYRSPDAIPTRVSLEFDVLDGDSAACLTLNGDEAIAFKDWWENHCKQPELTIIRLCGRGDEMNETSKNTTICVCQTCGELVPLGCCTCGPRQELRAIGPST